MEPASLVGRRTSPLRADALRRSVRTSRRTVRACVMGADDRTPTPEELARMRALLARSMDEGAIGLASGLIYPPSAFATTDELAALCEVVRDKGGLYASHIRNESTKLLDAVAENLDIGRRSGVRVELSHHKASGQKNWGKVKESTALIERARADGVDVTADQYPYTASSPASRSPSRTGCTRVGPRRCASACAIRRYVRASGPRTWRPGAPSTAS